MQVNEVCECEVLCAGCAVSVLCNLCSVLCYVMKLMFNLGPRSPRDLLFYSSVLFCYEAYIYPGRSPSLRLIFILGAAPVQPEAYIYPGRSPSRICAEAYIYPAGRSPSLKLICTLCAVPVLGAKAYIYPGRSPSLKLIFSLGAVPGIFCLSICLCGVCLVGSAVL